MPKKSVNFASSLLLIVSSIGFCNACSGHIHSFDVVDYIEPTCTEKGVFKHLYCSKCKKDFSVNTKEEVTKEDLEIAPLGHNYAKPGEYIKYPSCLEDGIIRESCTRCDSYQDINVAKYNEHVFDHEVESDEFLYSLGDCTHKSIYYKSCGCGEKSENEFFEGEYHHELNHIEAKGPTDTKEGNIDYFLCSSCDEAFTLEDGKYVSLKTNPYYGKDICLYRKDGRAVNILPKVVRDYLSLEDDKSTENNEIAEFLKKNESYFGQHEGFDAITLNWTGSNLSAPYTVTLYSDENLNQVVKEYTGLTQKSVDIENLIPGQYWYQVKDSSNPSIISSVDTFTFSSHLRTINGRNTIYNMRDLGGWKNKAGQKIRYGMLYRSAGWSSQSEHVDEFIKELGIKTEIDVRHSRGTGSDMSVSEHPIEGVNYFANGFNESYTSMLTETLTIEHMKTFFDILEDENNYPIAYHCAGGADRTGLASLLIESVLGLNDIDIYRDYELTSFYYSKRLRSDVEVDENGNYQFNPSGSNTLDGWSAEFGRITSTFYLKPYYGEGDTIADAVTKFLIARAGVTQEQINKVRSLMLE